MYTCVTVFPENLGGMKKEFLTWMAAMDLELIGFVTLRTEMTSATLIRLEI
jgi:hypothetical protein